MKKAEPPKDEQPLERGQYARLLADGFVIEVTPSEERVPKARKPKSTVPKA